MSKKKRDPKPDQKETPNLTTKRTQTCPKRDPKPTAVTWFWFPFLVWAPQTQRWATETSPKCQPSSTVIKWLKNLSDRCQASSGVTSQIQTKRPHLWKSSWTPSPPKIPRETWKTSSQKRQCKAQEGNQGEQGEAEVLGGKTLPESSLHAQDLWKADILEEGRIFRLLKRAVCSQQNNAQPGAATLQLSISVFDKQQNPAQPSKIPSLCHPEIKATRHLPHQKTGILPAQPTAPGWHFSSLNTKQAENLKKQLINCMGLKIQAALEINYPHTFAPHPPWFVGNIGIQEKTPLK